jgi:hypothetical protein
MPVWVRMTDTNRYKLLQRSGETEEQVLRALLAGEVSQWAPVASGREDGWRLVNIQHVLWVESGPEDSGGYA